MLTIHSREHRFLFSYLLLATGLLAGLAAWMLCHNHNFQSTNANSLSSKLARLSQLFSDQREYLPRLDSAHHAVAAYNPQVTAIFIEADIDNQLSSLRQLYVQQQDTAHFYRAFDQVANFYQMLYQDKKRLAAAQDEIQRRTKDLIECSQNFQPKGPSAPVIAPAAALAPAAPLATPPTTPH